MPGEAFSQPTCARLRFQGSYAARSSCPKMGMRHHSREPKKGSTRQGPYAAAAASRTWEFNPTRGDQKKREARRVAYQALYTASAASWNTESGASSRWQKGADTCFHGVVSETGVCRSVICGPRRELQRSLRVLQEALRGRATQRCRSCRSPSDPARTPHVNSEKL